MKVEFKDDHYKRVRIKSRTIIKRFNKMKSSKLEKLSLNTDISGYAYFKYDDEIKYVMNCHEVSFLFEAYYYYLKELNNENNIEYNSYVYYHICMFMCLNELTSNDKLLEIKNKITNALILDKLEDNDDFILNKSFKFIDFLIDKRLS